MILLLAKPRHLFLTHQGRTNRQHTACQLCCQQYDAKETWRCGRCTTATLPLEDAQARHRWQWARLLGQGRHGEVKGQKGWHLALRIVE